MGKKSFDVESYTKDSLRGFASETRLLGKDSSSSLREVRFSDQEFAAGTPISNIKYDQRGF